MLLQNINFGKYFSDFESSKLNQNYRYVLNKKIGKKTLSDYFFISEIKSVFIFYNTMLGNVLLVMKNWNNSTLHH